MKIKTAILAALSCVAFSNAAEIGLKWSDNSDNETGFIIEASTDGGEFAEVGRVGIDVETFQHSIDESTVTEVVYRVKAYNYFGESGYTNNLEVLSKHFTPIDNDPNGLQIDANNITINANSVTVNQN